MEAILEYASSSPDEERERDVTSSSSRPAASTGPLAAARDDAKKRQLEVARWLASRAKGFRHQSSREEDAFAFRGYKSKRRRRHSPGSSQSAVAGVAKDAGVDLPLIVQPDEALEGSTSGLKSDKMLPLCRRSRRRFGGHEKAVNELQWHPQHPELFLSASMDATVRIWNVTAVDRGGCRRVLTQHSLGVKSAKWSIDGRTVLSGGYDGLSCCVNTETGQVEQELRQRDITATYGQVERITTVCFHPTEPNSVLLGTDHGHIYGHDLRSKTAQREVNLYKKSFGDVHDLLFLGDDAYQFVSSASVIQRDASNQTLLVWDWRSPTLLYDHLDNNMLAHSCLRAHPIKPYFVAQCSGNYASIFSSYAPYKCIKGASVGGRHPPLRFHGGHEVEGYGIQCSFSPDGVLLASGDANGRVVLYQTTGSRQVMESFQLYGDRTPCICAEYEANSTASLPRLLTGSSAGDINLFE